jgi:hypothetical protein
MQAHFDICIFRLHYIRLLWFFLNEPKIFDFLRDLPSGKVGIEKVFKLSSTAAATGPNSGVAMIKDFIQGLRSSFEGEFDLGLSDAITTANNFRFNFVLFIHSEALF